MLFHWLRNLFDFVFVLIHWVKPFFMSIKKDAV